MEFNIEKLKIEKQIANLKLWFEREYNYKEQKYRRLIVLNKPDDDGVDANTKLNELYILAEEKRSQIQGLEKELEN